MSFLKGSMSFTRYSLEGRMPFTRYSIEGQKPQDPLEVLEANKFGTQRIVRGYGGEAGFVAGELFDLKFEHGKNLVDGTLFFGMRIDSIAPPGSVVRAYYQQEAEAIRPDGQLSPKQKKEARAAARERVNDEVRAGKHRRQKVVPFCVSSGSLLIGATGSGLVQALDAYTRAFSVDLRGPLHSSFASTIDPTDNPLFEPATNDNRSIVVNEFLMWLWWRSQNMTDRGMMVDKVIQTKCPKAFYGQDAFRGDAPGGLPEARQAIKAGRMPSKIGMIVDHEGEQYSFVLDDRMAVTGARLPKTKELIDRVEQIRVFLWLLDDLVGEFTHDRIFNWSAVRKLIDEWRRL